MAIQGNTKTFGLNEIIQSISMNQHSGVIEIECNDLERKGLKRHLFFDKGNLIIICREDGPALDFVDLLPRIGILPKENLKSLLESQRDPKAIQKRLGEFLCEKKIIPEKILQFFVYKFYENEIFEMHSWTDADFLFHMNVSYQDRFGELDSYLLISTPGERIVMEVLRQIDEVDLLKEKISDFGDFYLFLPEKKGGLAELKLNPVQKRVIQFLDGSLNLEDLLKEVFIGKFGLYQMMEMLIDRGMVRLLNKQELKEKAGYWQEMGKADKAVTFLERILSSHETDIPTRLELAELFRDMEIYDKASGHFEFLGNQYIERKEYNEAITYLKDALRMVPSNTEIQEKLYRAYLAQRDSSNARKISQNLYLTYKSEENYEKIEEIYQSLVELDPSDMSSKMILAEALAKKENKNIPQAILLYREVAQNYEVQNKQEQARRVHKLILEINPRQSDSLRMVRQNNPAKGGGFLNQYRWPLLGVLLVSVLALLFLFVFN